LERYSENRNIKVSCSVAKWPKKDKIGYSRKTTFLIGNFSADITIKITKLQNKVPIKTALTKARVTTGKILYEGKSKCKKNLVAGNKTSPWDLWCPQENTFIYGDLGDPSIVDDYVINPINSDSYKECAKRYLIRNCTEKYLNLKCTA